MQSKFVHRLRLVSCALALLFIAIAAFGLLKNLPLITGLALAGMAVTGAGYVGAARCLSELQAEHRALAESVKQHSDAHTKLVTDISHELRTPITILRAQIEALQDGVQKPNSKTFSVIHSGIMTLSRLVDDLHDLSKSDFGELRYSFAPVNVVESLAEVLDTFKDRFEQKKIGIDAGALTEQDGIIQGDSDRLRQLFSNILENSLRYTNEGGKVVISAERDQKHVSLYFADSAPGVASDMLPRIFDRFFRTESSRSRVFGGSGLGLAICKTIVEGHGGTIRACQSSLGGLAVEIIIPRERAANV